MGISSAGIGSGLDVNGIVASLMKQEQRPLTASQAQETKVQAQLTAYGTLKSSLAGFNSALAALSAPSNFSSQTANLSDNTSMRAIADSTATPGGYAINVSQLAQSAKVASAGFANLTDQVGAGAMTIEFGTYTSATNTFTTSPSKASKVITIDATNNTLSGIRDAINTSNAGVTATIVNDGSTSGNRLVITSTDTGSTNSIKISTADNDGNNLDNAGLSRLAYDPAGTLGAGKNLSSIQDAKDALLTVDGIPIKKSTNAVSDAILGVTLNLTKVSAADTILTVAKDMLKPLNTLDAFVKAYNDLSVTSKTLSKYDVAGSGKNNGPLIGDSTTRTILTQVQQSLIAPLSGTNINNLSRLGIDLQKDGTLTLDIAKLNTAVSTYPNEMSKVFSSTSTFSDPSVGFVSSTAQSKSGIYAVNITQSATNSTLTGNAAPNLTVAAGVNDALSINVNNTPYSLTLTAKTYATSQDLVNEIQLKLTAAGVRATASLSSGFVALTSTDYGTDSAIGIPAGNAAAGLFGTPARMVGLNVAGTIGGLAATAIGQQLTGAAGGATDGLVIKVNSGATGSRGLINFSAGYASTLTDIVSKFLNSDGLLKNKTDGLNSTVARLTQQQSDINLRLAIIEKNYRAQFTALDKKISQLSSTSSFLTQQLAQFNASAKA